MAHNRIDPREARTIWFPKFTVEHMTASELLDKEINVIELTNRVPVNTPLLASVEREGFKNPFLCMNNYWCIAGSQRLRVAHAIREENPSWDAVITVYKLLEHPWEPLHLWNQDKLVAVYFQPVLCALYLAFPLPHQFVFRTLPVLPVTLRLTPGC